MLDNSWIQVFSTIAYRLSLFCEVFASSACVLELSRHLTLPSSSLLRNEELLITVPRSRDPRRRAGSQKGGVLVRLQRRVGSACRVLGDYASSQSQLPRLGAESRNESWTESLAEVVLAQIVLQALTVGPLSKSEIAHALGRESVSGVLNRKICQLLY